MANKKKNRSRNKASQGNMVYSRTVETTTDETYTRPRTKQGKPRDTSKDYQSHGGASKEFRTHRDSQRSRQGDRRSSLDSRVKSDEVRHNAAVFQGQENDPSWYNSNGQLVQDAASVSFYTPAGAPFFPDYRHQYPTKGAALPGIMTLDVIPTPGISTDRASALNLAALKLYTGMRKANSGAVNYSHSDLMMYCLAMDSVYIMYSEMLRLYGIMNCWSQYNRYKPEDIVTALGYDYTDFRENLADFRAWLNIWIKRANSFSLPVSFTISKRHSWLFSNIWADSTSAKAQLYAYRPAIYYLWDDHSSDQGSQLKATLWNCKGVWNQKKTFAKVKQSMDHLLDLIANSDDIAIMGGDLEKAFGSNNMFSMASIDENYSIAPTFSEEVLMQIENSMFLPGVNYAYTDSWNITQNVDENKIVYNPTMEVTATGTGTYDANTVYYMDYKEIYANGLPLNVHFDNPKPDDVMVATRNKFLAEVDTSEWDHEHGGELFITFDSVGCDIITDVSIWTKINYDENQEFTVWNPTFNGFNVKPYMPNYFRWSEMDQPSLGQIISSIIAIDVFDWHPAVYAGICLDENQNAADYSQVNYTSMDLDNYTRLAPSTLRKIHDAAVYNMWELPI